MLVSIFEEETIQIKPTTMIRQKNNFWNAFIRKSINITRRYIFLEPILPRKLKGYDFVLNI
jgi:hypothetical protein